MDLPNHHVPRPTRFPHRPAFIAPHRPGAQDLLLNQKAGYEAASSAEEFALADRSARIVPQYENLSSSRAPDARDLYMAENAIWRLDRAGPDAKIILWARNGHVATNPDYGNAGSMGFHLR